MRIVTNMNEQEEHVLVNSSKLFSPLVSSSTTPVRTRTVISVIYISGIVFMLTVFLVLLWVNLYSRRCWCWHDTPLIHRFYRPWLINESTDRQCDTSSKRQRRSSSHDHRELPF